MLVPIVFLSLVVIVVLGFRARRWWRRRTDPPMYVTPWPEIEDRQLYGGWNADAYDAGTGHDRQTGSSRSRPSGDTSWPGGVRMPR
jgi:hypothetical protein